MLRFTKFLAVVVGSACAAVADPVAVRHTQGFLHGFLLLKDTGDKILASGELVQSMGGGRITSVLTFHFRDGSSYLETAVYSQQRVFRLLRYQQIEKGPAFKTPLTLSLDSSGKVSVTYSDKDGKEKTESEQMKLPPDLANGMLPVLLANIDPAPEKTLSMVVATPKPRLVQLKISNAGQDSFSIGDVVDKATRFLVKVDLGAVTGAVAKIVAKQPPPTQVWIGASAAPNFLKSEGPLFEDAPLWRIELASPVWGKTQNP